MPVYSEEIFGRGNRDFSSEEEAVALANDTGYVLGASSSR
jgi:acyl-CoA reductase-like NAD-dependent aldehyde dehydrogenase